MSRRSSRKSEAKKSKIDEEQDEVIKRLRMILKALPTNGGWTTPNHISKQVRVNYRTVRKWLAIFEWIKTRTPWIEFSEIGRIHYARRIPTPNIRQLKKTEAAIESEIAE